MFQCKQLLILLLVCNLAWFGVAVGPIQVIVPQSASENGASPTIFYPRVRRHSAISIEDVVQVHVAKKR